MGCTNCLVVIASNDEHGFINLFVASLFFIELYLSLPSQEKWELIKGQDNIEISAYLFYFYSCTTLYCSL